MEDAIRAALRDLSEEAIPLNLSHRAIRGAARRRTLLAGVGVAVLAAIGVTAAPLALASGGDNPPAPPRPTLSPVPCTTAPGPGPTLSPPPLPTAPPSPEPTRPMPTI